MSSTRGGPDLLSPVSSNWPHCGPWCFTPDFYSSNPEFMDKVAAFVRSRPEQPLDVFMRQSNAVIAHDAVARA
jgi:hypothetical protein